MAKSSINWSLPHSQTPLLEATLKCSSSEWVGLFHIVWLYLYSFIFLDYFSSSSVLPILWTELLYTISLYYNRFQTNQENHFGYSLKNNNIYLSSYLVFQTIRDEGFLEKWLIPTLEQRKHKMRLDHLIMPKSKELLKEGWEHIKNIQESAWRGSYCPNMGHLGIKINNDSNRI